MKHLAAYLLLSLKGGSPTQKDVKKLLKTAGIEADEDRLEKLFSELEGKDINAVISLSWTPLRSQLTKQLIQEGSTKLSSVPSGGGGAVAAASSAGAGAATTADGETAPAEDEKKEEPAEESDEDVHPSDCLVNFRWDLDCSIKELVLGLCHGNFAVNSSIEFISCREAILHSFKSLCLLSVEHYSVFAPYWPLPVLFNECSSSQSSLKKIEKKNYNW